MNPQSYHYALEEKGLDSLQANIMHLKKILLFENVKKKNEFASRAPWTTIHEIQMYAIMHDIYIIYYIY